MEYNAVTDFSTAANPNGVWQYLAEGTLLTTQLLREDSMAGGTTAWTRLRLSGDTRHWRRTT
jgi:hypothetical protein